jgi:hypothetical protein
LTPKNPLTNEIIVAEVGFYFIPFESLKNQEQILIAIFMGSDYNYATERSFRDEFRVLTPTIHADLLEIGLREGNGAQSGENAQAGPPLYDDTGRNCLIPLQ